MTISAGASASAGHYRTHSLGGFHQLKRCQGRQAEIATSWPQRTPAGHLLSVTRRTALQHHTTRSEEGKQLYHQSPHIRSLSQAGSPSAGSHLERRLQTGREPCLPAFQNKLCWRGLTGQQETRCKCRASRHARRAWILALLEPLQIFASGSTSAAVNESSYKP